MPAFVSIPETHVKARSMIPRYGLAGTRTTHWARCSASVHRALAPVLLLALWLAGPAQATADGPDFYRARNVAPADSVPLRAAPQDDAPAVGRIGADATCLRNLGCQGGLSLEEFGTLSEPARQQRLAENPRWCQVLYQGRSGWMPGRYLAESATACARSRDSIALAGSGSVVRRGQIRGDGFADHLVQGRAGQTLAVTLKGSHAQNYVNLNPPGSQWAMFVGSMSGNHLERVLPVDGLYVVRVYLMRAAARREAVSRYALTLRLSGEPLQARDSAQDARVAGTVFHAQATVACRQAREPARSGSCSAAVIRYQRSGSATVELRWTDGGVARVRRLLFVDGRAVDSDAVEPVRMLDAGDPYRVDVGADEHYELPHALVSGG